MAIRSKKLDKVSQQVVISYGNGMSMDEIAKLHNVSKGTVRNALKANGVELRGRGRPKITPVAVQQIDVTEGVN